MIGSRKLLFGFVILACAALPAGDAYTQATRANPNYIDNENSPLETLKLKLTQIYPNRTAIVVTTQDGEMFSDARLRLGAKSPWRINIEYQCPGAGDLDNRFFMRASKLRQLTFSGYPQLRLDDNDYFGDATAGEIELLYWQHYPVLWEEDHEKLKQAAINSCNRAADRIQSENSHYLRKRAMSKVGKITPFQNRPYGKFKGLHPIIDGKCVGTMYEEIDYNSIEFVEYVASYGGTNRWWINLVVDCQAAAVEPYDPIGANSLTTNFSVTNVVLDAQPKLVADQCPRDVAFRGRISGQGEGRVRYRIRGSDGSISPIRVAHVKSGLKPADINFTRTFGEPSTGGLTAPPPDERPERPDGLSTEPPDPDPSGPTLETTAPEPPTPPEPVTDALATPTVDGEHSGWYRIEIVSPLNGKRKSREANYKVICLDPAPDGLTLPPKPVDPPADLQIRNRNP